MSPLLRRSSGVVTLAVCAIAAASTVTAVLSSDAPAPGARFDQGSVEVAGDAYSYLVYVPRAHPASMPLLVVLHGCTMTAAEQAAASGYDPLAERRRLIVLYPDVDVADQVHGRCWKGIWNPGQDAEGRGDAGAIALMTNAVIRRWRVDRSRVYVIGISAGAYESSILGATHPGLYAAIGIHSGAGYLGGGLGCSGSGEPPAPIPMLGRAALAAMRSAGHLMPVIVFHGDRDPVVPDRCARQALKQWLITDNLVLGRADAPPVPITPTSVTHGVIAHGHAYTVTSYLDRAKCPVAQLWLIHGMGHRWSGGSNDPSVATYADPRGPSAAAASLNFFLSWRHTGAVDTCIAPGSAVKTVRAGG